MNDLKKLGLKIKEKRLSLNLRMDDVAKKAGITRATLCSIEKGNSNCSIISLFKVMDILDLYLSVNDTGVISCLRERASRINTALDKQINRFVIMCVEQYAQFANQDSGVVYQEMKDKGILEELSNDFEDLHGMSTLYLNEYIHSLLTGVSS